jgi:hypothetical protein
MDVRRRSSRLLPLVAVAAALGPLAAATAPSAWGSTPGSTPGSTRGSTPGTSVTVLPSAHKILAVKVPNASPRDFPQVGLPNADLVYTELVEAGLTRHVAVYSSSVPPKVVPVRSLRETDLMLLGQYGRIGIGFSGHARAMKPLVDASPHALFSEQLHSPEVYRDLPRCDLTAMLHCAAIDAPRAMAKLAGTGGRGVVHARAGLPVGTVATAAATSGRPLTSLTMDFPQRLSVTWSPTQRHYVIRTGSFPSTGMRWDAPTRRWVSTPLTAASVVVQSVSLTNVRVAYPCRTPWAGTPDPVYRSNSLGSGQALLLRDGRVYPLRWSRSNEAYATTFRHVVTGTPGIRVPGGRPWVFLLPDRATAYLGSTRWNPALPLPRPTGTDTPPKPCAHPVIMTAKYLLRDGGTDVLVSIRDEWYTRTGTPVAGVSVRLTDAAGTAMTAVTSSSGHVLVPRSMLATGWARVDLPAAATRQGGGLTVLSSMNPPGGAITGTATDYSINQATGVEVRDGLRTVRVMGAYHGVLGPIAAQIRVKPITSSTWQWATAPAATRFASAAAIQNSSLAQLRLNPYVAFHVQIVGRSANGRYEVSNLARVGPVTRAMTWSWSPTLRVGALRTIAPPSVSPAGTPTYSSSTPAVCSVVGTATKYVKGLAAGTCRLRAYVAGTTAALPAARYVTFAVTR